ncbi:hypothetical protein FRC11_012854, partial [Ceratobasidium sp. 423]
MLRITAVALASLALATIVPMGAAGRHDGNGTRHVGVPIDPPRTGSVPGPSLWRRACQPGQYSPHGTCQSCGKGYYCFGNGDRNAATSGNIPSGALKRGAMTACPYGTTRCEVKSGRGGFECVDTLNSLETCGGCDSDCSLLDGTNEVQCFKGHCVIKSCSPGYDLTPRGDGVSRGGLD